VAYKNAYGDFESYETSYVPELINNGCRLAEVLNRKNILWAPFSCLSHAKIRAGVFFECCRENDPHMAWCRQNGIPTLLVITENMFLQPNLFYATIKPWFDKILTYWDLEVDGDRIEFLPYALDFAKGVKFLSGLDNSPRPLLLGTVSSWKKSSMPGDLYGKRNRLAIGAAKILGKKMAIWGPGWKHFDVFPKKWQRTIAKRSRFLSRLLFGWPNRSVRGPLPRGEEVKWRALAQGEFCLCMENNRELSGYITEKIFNAFFAGCVPCYQGDPGAVRWIPPDTFVSMEGIETGAELVRRLRAISREEIRGYRERALRFLESSQSRIFDSSAWVAKVAGAIEGLLEKRAQSPRGG
jgi:hypothetical protein